MTDSRVIPVKQLELRYHGIAHDVRRLKGDMLTTTSAMSYKGDIFTTFVDWDDYTAMGTYRVGLGTFSGSANAPPASVYPYGTLVVYSADLSVTQTYYPHNTNLPEAVWTRTKWNASDWRPWAGSPLWTVFGPQTPTWTFRRQAAAQSFTTHRAEFEKIGSRVIGTGHVNITDTNTGVGDIDVTFTGLGTPTYSHLCGIGVYYDVSEGLPYIPLVVYVETSSRFYFIRSDTAANSFFGTALPAVGDNCNGDYLEWKFDFRVN